MKRRDFMISGVAGAAASAALATRPKPSYARRAANEQVNLALIGGRDSGRGIDLTEYFCALPEVQFPYVCDVDQNVVGPVMDHIEKSKGKRPALVEDIRRVLDDKSVDGVVVATPIHWHAPGTILACEAGKDVYVEKPCSHNVREGRLMVEAARKHQRVVQVGTQSRSRPVAQRFVDYVQSGKIGKLLIAKVWNTQMRRNIGHLQDEPVPTGINYDIWSGPGVKLPFNRNHFHTTYNWNWHYGGGDIANDGVHWIDIARWALALEYPTEVSGMGCKLYFDDDQQTPDTQNITWNYGEKLLMFEQRLWNRYKMDGSENGVSVYGTDGMAQIAVWEHGTFGFRVFNRRGKEVHLDQESRGKTTHYQNFIDCIRSREQPNADIAIGHISTALCHLGNIVTRTGRNFKFNPQNETIEGDAEANQLLTREYRQHWSSQPFLKS